MAYSYPLYQRIEAVLQKDEWKYEFDEERELFRVPGVGLGKNMIQRCDVVIDVQENRFISYATIDMNCRADSLPEMYKLLHLINWHSVFGTFEIDARDGEIRYKMAVDCDDCLPSEKIIRRAVVIPCTMFQDYGDAICSVIFGVKDAQTAYDDASKN